MAGKTRPVLGLFCPNANHIPSLGRFRKRERGGERETETETEAERQRDRETEIETNGLY